MIWIQKYYVNLNSFLFLNKFSKYMDRMINILNAKYNEFVVLKQDIILQIELLDSTTFMERNLLINNIFKTDIMIMYTDKIRQKNSLCLMLDPLLIYLCRQSNINLETSQFALSEYGICLELTMLECVLRAILLFTLQDQNQYFKQYENYIIGELVLNS